MESMDLDHRCKQFDDLPTKIKDIIFRLLPVSTLLICKQVSKSWLSFLSDETFIISYPQRRHPKDVVFLIFVATPEYVGQSIPKVIAAYIPARDRWVRFAIPRTISKIFKSGTTHLMAQLEDSDSDTVIFRPLSSDCRLVHLPGKHPSLNIVTLIEFTASEYVILACTGSASRHVESQIYFSDVGHWKPCPQPVGHDPLPGQTVYLSNAVFCLTTMNEIWKLDLDVREWRRLDLMMPSPDIAFPHILVFSGKLHLVAGIKRQEEIIQIVIWVLESLKWTVLEVMPDNIFIEFSSARLYGSGVGKLYSFRTIDRLGIIGFYDCGANKLLLHDLVTKTWRWSSRCNVFVYNADWLGTAVELHIGLLQ